MATSADTVTVDARMPGWLEAFKHYRAPPTSTKIGEWLDLFRDEHKDLAKKVLDNVTVVGEMDILTGYKAALKSIPGWHIDPTKREGNWFFVGFGKPGESGPAMLRLFREANNLAYARYDTLFRTLSELASLELEAKDHVIFVDDFSGSGKQVLKMWPTIEEMVASEASCYLVLTALTDLARRDIERDTELHILAKYDLDPSFSLFHENNTSFTDDERDVIESYCAFADPSNPKGVGNLGVMFVLSHKSANNCLPILHINTPQWRGILPRYLKP